MHCINCNTVNIIEAKAVTKADMAVVIRFLGRTTTVTFYWAGKVAREENCFHSDETSWWEVWLDGRMDGWMDELSGRIIE